MSKEVLFSAVDNAATRQEWDALMEAVARDPAIKKQWSQIWEWRDARDGIAVRKSSDDFVHGVMAALNQPQTGQSPRAVPLPVTAVRAPARGRVSNRSWKTWVPLSAAAGALAAALLFGAGGLNLAGSPAPAAAVVATAPAAATQPVRWTAGDDHEGKTPDADTAALLDGYLMEHSNTVAQHDVGGTLAGARFAVQTAAYQAGE